MHLSYCHAVGAGASGPRDRLFYKLCRVVVEERVVFFVYYCGKNLHVGTMETAIAFHVLLRAAGVLIIAGLLWVCP